MSKGNVIKIIGDTMMTISTPIIILCLILDRISIAFTVLELLFIPFSVLGFMLGVAGSRIERLENKNE